MNHPFEKDIESIGNAFSDFKEEQSKRLKDLESKAPQLENNIKEIGTRVQDIQKKLSIISMHKEGPTIEMGPSDKEKSLKALADYIIYGKEEELRAMQTKAFGIDNNDKEILIPQNILQIIESELLTYSPLRQLSSVITIKGKAFESIRPSAPSSTSASWYGKLKEGIPSKGTATPTINKVSIPTNHLIAAPLIASDIVNYGFPYLEKWLAARINDGITFAENKAFLWGDGVDEPRGLIHADSLGKPEEHKLEQCTIVIKDHFFENLAKLVYGFPKYYLAEASWLVSGEFLAILRGQLKSLSKYDPSLVFFDDKGREYLFGFPIIVCDEFGLTKDSLIHGVFGNFKRGYVIVDQGKTEILRDPYSKQPHTLISFSKKVGGGIFDAHALKVLTLKAE